MRQRIHTQFTTIADMKSVETTEDTLFVGNDGERLLFMVADGAPQRVKTRGSLRPLLAQYGEGTTPGRYAALLCREMSATLFRHAPTMPLHEMALQINQRLRDQLVRIYGDLTAEAILAHEPDLPYLAEDPRYVRLPLPICCYTAARLDLVSGHLSYVHGGDTALFLLYKDGRTVQITPDQMGQHDDRMRAAIKQVIEAHAPQSREAFLQYWPPIQDLNIRNGVFHNYEDAHGNTDPAVGVGVINGMPQLEAYLVTGDLDTADLDGFLLSSDGFFWPNMLGETPAQAAARVDQMGHLIRAEGLTGYVQALRAEELSDLDGAKYLRFGALDDCTAIFVDLR